MSSAWTISKLRLTRLAGRGINLESRQDSETFQQSLIRFCHIARKTKSLKCDL